MPQSAENKEKKVPHFHLKRKTQPKPEKAKITIIDYDEKNFSELEVKTIEECFHFNNKETVTWINIDGVHQDEVIEKIGECFNLHHLTVEDIANTKQRPKIEDFEDHILMILKMLNYDAKANKVETEQISLILGPQFVISFQEREGDVFNEVRERIRNKTGRIRSRGSDYLAYALIDSIVNSYFVIIEKFGEKIEVIEDKLVTDPKPETLQSIYSLKKTMIFLRRSVWPLREVVNCLERGESKLIQHSTIIYMRDVYEQTIQVIESIETYREMLLGMLEVYLSSVSNRMNEVMKVLTIIATIFIPLTFIAGIYGMNFKVMPEIVWKWGYFVVLGFMLAVGVTMVVLFKRKKWF